MGSEACRNSSGVKTPTSFPLPEARCGCPATRLRACRGSQRRWSSSGAPEALETRAGFPPGSRGRAPRRARPSTGAAGRPPRPAPLPRAAAARRKARGGSAKETAQEASRPTASISRTRARIFSGAQRSSCGTKPTLRSNREVRKEPCFLDDVADASAQANGIPGERRAPFYLDFARRWVRACG